MTPDLVAVGEVVLDVVADALPVARRRVHAGVRARPGGSPVTAARAATGAGASAAVVGRVGDDWAGRAVAAELEREGILPLLAVDPELPTGVVVSFADAVERAVVADRGAGARLAADDVPADAAARALLVSGYALLAEGSPAAAGERALVTAAAEWRAVDLGSAGLVRARGRDTVSARLRNATAVLAGAEEAEALTGERDPAAAAAALAAGRRLGCVTLGSAGAVAVADGEALSARPTRVREGDLIGAGDAFAGTLLVLLCGGATAREALHRACAAAAGWDD